MTPDTAVAQREVRQEPPAIYEEPTGILAVIERAARDPNVDIEKMRQLLDMRREEEDRIAKREYSAALAEMQQFLPVIRERGRIDIGRGKPQSYALWEDINEAIRPILAKHGFGLSFRVDHADDRLKVTGVLSHAGGHSEQTTISLPFDNSGSKNAVQAVGSSTSYGKRYTAAALLNLTSTGEDDDGQAAGAGEPITTEQRDKLASLIEETGADIAAFCAFLKVEALADLPAKSFPRALAALEAKKAKGKSP